MIHAKPDLRVVLKWMIARSGSVITDVIPPKLMNAAKNKTLSEVFKDCRKIIDEHAYYDYDMDGETVRESYM